MDTGDQLSLDHPPTIEENWSNLNQIIHATLSDEESWRYLHLLDVLKDDVATEGGILLGFLRAPAAKGNHHAFEGGLISHLLEMWGLWRQLKESLTCAPYIDDRRVLKAILLHDLHKANRTYRLLRQEPWAVEYCNDPTDMLMTSDVKSLWLAQSAGIQLDPEQINALLWAEGGFSTIRPKWCSVLAKVCYTLDELSGNGMARIKNRTLLNHTRREA